jgi:hypothetical protein
MKLPRVDYLTHYTYVTRLEKLSQALTVACSVTPKLAKCELARAAAKSKLVDLTWQSIKDEQQIVDADEEYSTASVLWLPVKTYYLLYHILSIIDFMISGEPQSLTIQHGEITDVFTRRVQSQELILSEPRFNAVFDRRIFTFKEKSGAHLSTTASDELIYTLVMKKIALYKLENKRLARHWNLKRAKDREKQVAYVANMSVSIFDFFYLMRIKSNYRGFNFIADIPASDTAKYFRAYFQTAANFYSCFWTLKRDLEAQL